MDNYASPNQDSYLLTVNDKNNSTNTQNSSQNKPIEEDNIILINNKSNSGILYLITHMTISFFAVYLSWRCNKHFDIGSFICALFCPYLYIIWALAVHGGCGVFESL